MRHSRQLGIETEIDENESSMSQILGYGGYWDWEGNGSLIEINISHVHIL